jgi:hypothetical protein
MGLLDRLFGRSPRRYARYEGEAQGRPSYDTPPSTTPSSAPPAYGTPSSGTPAYGTPPPYPPEPGHPQQPNQARDDEEAIRRYRYLLRTAPPEAIEQAHAEAFAQLTPDQRRQVLGQLANAVPEHERVRDDDPRSLARMATRAEMRSPGLLERVLGGGYGPGYGPGYGRGYGGGGLFGGGYGGGMGMGGMLAGGLLASVAGSFIGTAIAEEMFDHDQYMASGFGDYDGGGGDPGAGDSGIDFDNQNVDTGGVDDRTLADTGQDTGQDAGYGAYGPDDGGGSDFGDFGDGGDFGGDGDW